MERLTLEQIQAKRPVHWVDTAYGVQVGLKKISAAVLLEFQTFRGPDGSLTDPLAAYRLLVRSSVAEPAPTPDVMAWLEDDWDAFFALARQALAFNGLSPKAQADANSTFREGSDGPANVPS